MDDSIVTGAVDGEHRPAVRSATACSATAEAGCTVEHARSISNHRRKRYSPIVWWPCESMQHTLPVLSRKLEDNAIFVLDPPVFGHVEDVPICVTNKTSQWARTTGPMSTLPCKCVHQEELLLWRQLKYRAAAKTVGRGARCTIQNTCVVTKQRAAGPTAVVLSGEGVKGFESLRLRDQHHI